VCSEGHEVGRKRVASMLKVIGIEDLYRKPKMKQRHPEHKVYPYLLRKLTVTRANQVWVMDITYIPMARCFEYLAAVVDWHSRRVLNWKLSTTIDTHFCLFAVEEALVEHVAPEIMKTDQGGQFSSLAFAEIRRNLLAGIGHRFSS